MHVAIFTLRVVHFSDSVRLAEGLEPPEFWSQLGGKSKYPQFISAEYPLHTMPVLYSCEMRQGMVLFTQLYATKKEDLKSDISYLLSYKDKVIKRHSIYPLSRVRYSTCKELSS